MAFKDWELPKYNCGKSKLNENQIAITYHSNGGGSNLLTINSYLSEKIKERGYSFLNIKQDDITGEIGIEVNHERGLKLHVNKGGRMDTYHIQSTGWVSRLAKILAIDDNSRCVFSVTKNISTSEKCIFFRIIGKLQ